MLRQWSAEAHFVLALTTAVPAAKSHTHVTQELMLSQAVSKDSGH